MGFKITTWLIIIETSPIFNSENWTWDCMVTCPNHQNYLMTVQNVLENIWLSIWARTLHTQLRNCSSLDAGFYTANRTQPRSFLPTRTCLCPCCRWMCHCYSHSSLRGNIEMPLPQQQKLLGQREETLCCDHFAAICWWHAGNQCQINRYCEDCLWGGLVLWDSHSSSPSYQSFSLLPCVTSGFSH